ncbi:MAG TPA: succinylglutamate desuccinylase/aspartoacylase family protein [Ramlibacter sp.]|nr:succinylglutamate desuccinylase/aspartoacylase family protein [Ramlibacter sp.]
MTTITLEDGSPRTLPPAEALAASNCGVPGVWRFDSGAPGPHVAITALIHGNEVCGAEALFALLQQHPMLSRGRLTIAFCNLEAYGRLDDANKEERRWVDEDLNRVWGRLEDPGTNAVTYEIRRAREIAPCLDNVDVLLDLHSMSAVAPPLGLVGLASKNVAFAKRIGYPSFLIRDAGHAAGKRLIDRAPFGDADAPQSAMLVECGQHFSADAFESAHEAVRRTIAVFLNGKSIEPEPTQRLIEVVEAVTIRDEAFEFTQEWSNMSVVEATGTLIARDGDREVRTPHDNTYLVMPASARYRLPGFTAVRFGKLVTAA